MKIMKWLALAGVMAISPAWAGDMEPAAFSWTGLYVGAYGGYAWGGGDLADAYCDGVTAGHCIDNDIVSPTFGQPGTYVASTKMSDIIGGGLVGFNKEFHGGFVLGGEMDLGFGGSSDAHFVYGENLGMNSNPDIQVGNIDLGLTGSARMRAGFAVDHFMPFVTGGVAYAKYDASIVDAGNPDLPRSGSGNFIGWTFGGGLNYAVTDNLIIGAEYRFTNFGSQDVGMSNPALDTDTWNFAVHDFVTHDVRVSASYKF